MSTVTVTKKGQKFTVTFSRLPAHTFRPWGFPETIRDLTISALLTPLAARDLVMDAAVQGSATAVLT